MTHACIGPLDLLLFMAAGVGLVVMVAEGLRAAWEFIRDSFRNGRE